jgi:hypothetical protein
MANGADFPDTKRLRSASHVGHSMVPLAWSNISCARIDITEKKGRGGMVFVGRESQLSSNTVHSAVTARSAGGLDSESMAKVLGLAQVQDEPLA